MTDAEELELLELEAEAARGRKPAQVAPMGKSVLGRSKEMTSYRPGWADKSQAPGMVEEVIGGAKHAWDRASQGLAGLFGQTAVSPEQLAAGRAFVDETGPASTAGQVTTDVGMGIGTGGPILKGANLLRKTMAAKGIGGAGSAAVAADIAGNAGAAAALAPEDRLNAAAWGGGGAAGGRVLARTLGGPAKPILSPEAKTLSEAGVQLTPGQMVSGPASGFVGQTLRNFEDSMQSFPIVGDIIRHGRVASSKSWNMSEINQALAPIGEKVNRAGRAGIDAADDAISQTYNYVLPSIRVPQAAGQQAITDVATRAAAVNPLFDVAHANKLEMFVERRIKPLVDAGDVDGQVAKRLDAELGELARKYQNGGVGNEPLGDAFEMLRNDWRTALEGTTPEAKQVLQKANQAFAKLLPMKLAAQGTNSGFVTPGQLRQATNKLRHTPSQSSLAARDILPDSIPDSGTAGRLALHDLITPRAAAATAGGAATLGGLGAPAALAAGLAGLYTKTGANYMAKGGEDVLNALLRKLRQQPLTPSALQQLEEATRLLGNTGTQAYGKIGE